MELSPIFFYLFAGIAIASALMVVLKKNPVGSAFSLILVFFAFAAIYAMLEAHLVAALQILVYAGAIMVLFIFVIMLLNADVPSFDLERTTPLMAAVTIVLGVAFLWALVWSFQQSPTTVVGAEFSPARIDELGGNTKVISRALFSEYILPFELTSVLLLTGIVGAVALAKRRRS